MAGLRYYLALSVGVVQLAVPGAAAVEPPPKIEKPKPAPPTPPSMAPLPPAQFDGSLTIGGDNVAARKVESRLAVDVRLNGYGPYRFIVDSGADTSAIGIGIARDLALPVGRPAILNSMTARNLVSRVKVNELAVGSSRIADLEMPALQENYLGAHGMLGIDALAAHRLMMDFDKRVIRIEDSRKPMEYLPDAIVVMAKRHRGQLILTRVRAGNVRLDAVIDTGSQLTIGNSALRQQLLRSNRHKLETIEVTGVTGVTAKLQLITVEELQLGPVYLQNVPIAFADVPPFSLFGLDDEPALLLGTDFLENFRRISLDFRSRKVRFQLKRCSSQGMTFRTTTWGSASLLPSRSDPLVCGS